MEGVRARPPSRSPTGDSRHICAPFERALFAMVANRTLAPYSKLYCREQWLREEVFLPGGDAI